MYIADVIRHYLGWCPNTPALRAAPAVLVVPPEMIHPGLPDGGTGGSERISRGVSIALSGTKTLVRNKQLLWFSLLTGLMLTGLFIAQYMLHLYELHQLGTYPLDILDYSRLLVLTFVIELGTVFCLTVLLAGLILSLSLEEGRIISFREGLARAKEHLRTLADISVIMAFLGTAIYIAVLHFFPLQISMMLYPVFNLFPFCFVLLPEVYHIGPIGGTFAIQSGVTNTLVLFGINTALILMTLFVVPLLVLEKKRLTEAVAGSVTLMKNVWCEAIFCFLILVLVVSAAAMTSLLFRVVYMVVAPDMLLFWYPGDTWIAAAVLYMLILCGLAFVISTIAGIAAVNLYTYGKTGRMPGMAEGEPALT